MFRCTLDFALLFVLTFGDLDFKGRKALIALLVILPMILFCLVSNFCLVSSQTGELFANVSAKAFYFETLMASCNRGSFYTSSLL